MSDFIGQKSHWMYRLFVNKWDYPRLQHSLSYTGHSAEFPIGFIGGGPISAAEARGVIERVCGDSYGPILHLSLAPHDPLPIGIGHAMVHIVDHVPDDHRVYNGDAIIVTDLSKPFVIETLLGDCACIIVADGRSIGFIHCGTPELFAGLLDQFHEWWPGEMTSTHVFMGPCIGGYYYQYDPEMVPKKYSRFVLGAHETMFEAPGFDLSSAIVHELLTWGNTSGASVYTIDPFERNLKGEHQWASARYALFQKNTKGIGDGKSHRDCAFFSFRPDPAA